MRKHCSLVQYSWKEEALLNQQGVGRDRPQRNPLGSKRARRNLICTWQRGLHKSFWPLLLVRVGKVPKSLVNPTRVLTTSTSTLYLKKDPLCRWSITWSSTLTGSEIRTLTLWTPLELTAFAEEEGKPSMVGISVTSLNSNRVKKLINLWKKWEPNKNRGDLAILNHRIKIQREGHQKDYLVP